MEFAETGDKGAPSASVCDPVSLVPTTGSLSFAGSMAHTRETEQPSFYCSTWASQPGGQGTAMTGVDTGYLDMSGQGVPCGIGSGACQSLTGTWQMSGLGLALGVT